MLHFKLTIVMKEDHLWSDILYLKLMVLIKEDYLWWSGTVILPWKGENKKKFGGKSLACCISNHLS